MVRFLFKCALSVALLLVAITLVDPVFFFASGEDDHRLARCCDASTQPLEAQKQVADFGGDCTDPACYCPTCLSLLSVSQPPLPRFFNCHGLPSWVLDHGFPSEHICLIEYPPEVC